MTTPVIYASELLAWPHGEEVLLQATKALGGAIAGHSWMLQPARGLDSRRPLDVFFEPNGPQRILDLLVRIERGVYT
jgi:uncharacterized protein (DUF2384 family)